MGMISHIIIQAGLHRGGGGSLGSPPPPPPPEINPVCNLDMYQSLLQSCHFYASDLALLLLGGYYYATLARL